ncbi:4Fe-4S dicluster domain-containing protein [Novispirillum sp. DQ9]|uniref:4Fe-4S dicluster domain-containing protein n=1 Tax=Novispirillum sp. DQ9 TaxID=3398612 RepID=UPI003C7A339E
MTVPFATRFVALDPARCAHMRFGQVGCTRCIDVCPEGALTASSSRIALNPAKCEGCSGCVAVCPTGAMDHLDAAAAPVGHLPDATALDGAVVVVYSADRNAGLLDAVTAHGGGLPAGARCVPVPEVGAVGVAFMLAALARGARAVHVVATRAERGRLAAPTQAVELVNILCDGLAPGAIRAAVVEEDDPWVLGERLRSLPVPREPLVTAEARDTPAGAAGLRALLARLDRRTEPGPVSLPPGSPVGGITVGAARCTLCQACARACPGGALVVTTDVPRLGFIEADCVQCGVCRAVCPEKAIALEPRWAPQGAEEPRLLKEDELVACADCGATVGTRSALDRMTAVLAGHPMFQDPAALDRLKLCERCR